MKSRPSYLAAFPILTACFLLLVIIFFVRKTSLQPATQASSPVDVHFAQAQEHYRTHNYDLAIKEYKASIQDKADNVYAHYNLGQIYSERNQPVEAITEYQQAIKLKPDYWEAHLGLGLIYQRN